MIGVNFKKAVKTVKTVTIEDTEYNLHYSMFDCVVNVEDESFITYGISVELEADGIIDSKSSICDVFTTRSEAQNFIYNISENLVTPCTLLNIIEDTI